MEEQLRNVVFDYVSGEYNPDSIIARLNNLEKTNETLLDRIRALEKHDDKYDDTNVIDDELTELNYSYLKKYPVLSFGKDDILHLKGGGVYDVRHAKPYILDGESTISRNGVYHLNIQMLNIGFNPSASDYYSMDVGPDSLAHIMIENEAWFPPKNSYVSGDFTTTWQPYNGSNVPHHMDTSEFQEALNYKRPLLLSYPSELSALSFMIAFNQQLICPPLAADVEGVSGFSGNATARFLTLYYGPSVEPLRFLLVHWHSYFMMSGASQMNQTMYDRGIAGLDWLIDKFEHFNIAELKNVIVVIDTNIATVQTFDFRLQRWLEDRGFKCSNFAERFRAEGIMTPGEFYAVKEENFVNESPPLMIGTFNAHNKSYLHLKFEGNIAMAAGHWYAQRNLFSTYCQSYWNATTESIKMDKNVCLKEGKTFTDYQNAIISGTPTGDLNLPVDVLHRLHPDYVVKDCVSFEEYKACVKFNRNSAKYTYTRDSDVYVFESM